MVPLSAGDIVWVDFDPGLGSEQAGRRPAVVLSPMAYHENSRLAIVCPVTGNTAPWPTKCLLPDGLKTRGAVLVDQIRAVHRDRRGFRFIEKTPPDTLAEIRAIMRELLQIGER